LATYLSIRTLFSARSTAPIFASKRVKMPAVNEAAIQSALQAISSGELTSIRAAADLYGVSRGTLSNRSNGMRTRSEARQFQLFLSSEQERVLEK
jgi:helix-turn-helix, Psq domain